MNVLANIISVSIAIRSNNADDLKHSHLTENINVIQFYSDILYFPHHLQNI